MLRRISIATTIAGVLLVNAHADNWADGKSFGRSTLGHFKGNTAATISAPMTTDAQLSTVDGQRSGNGRVTCSSSQTPTEFMSVEYSGTSDISVRVEMDRNFDGVKEISQNFDGISGVCTNGVIKCSPDTWSGCNYYVWGFSSSSGLTLAPTQSSNLGGCYCVNSSCRSPSVTSRRSILNDLAGGISSPISDGHQYIITRTVNNGQRASFWGQNYSSCAQGSIPNVSASNIQSQTDTTAMAQRTDPTSAYYVVSTSASNNAVNLDNTYKASLNERSQTTLGSAENTRGTGDFSYNDAVDGEARHIEGNVQIGPEEVVQYCEVMWEEENTDAYADGTTRNQVSTEGASMRTEIRECTDNGTVCPLNPGETIKHPCGAINDFAEVTAGLYAVNEAAKDMVCSSH